MRAITTEECARYIEQAFDTPRQRQKARLILSGVFSTALKRGWCSENPVARGDAVKVREERIEILSPQEIKALLSAAKKYRGGICLAAVGMMLYAGIRPHEVARLSRLAGFRRWIPDVLRHTFAGYHLRHFRSYSELQYEMGHRDSNLLRTRYVSMSSIGNAAAFWA